MVTFKEDALAPDFRMKTFFPPTVAVIGETTYAFPGWIPVPVGTTVEELMERWEPIHQVDTHTPEREGFSMNVNSSNGDKLYTVSYGKSGWDCTCPGFIFRRRCRHIEEAKNKLKNKQYVSEIHFESKRDS